METFTPEALEFLSQLKQHNTREWFEPRKAAFKKHQQAAKAFYGGLEAALNTHDEIEKSKLFRIYRDVRFSRDKSPYNPHFAGSFRRAGTQRRGGYYLRVRPGESFAAIGFWNPEPKDLLRIRKELEVDAGPFREIIGAQDFLKAWGPIQGEQVKTAPKGFSREDPNLDLIRLKQFIFTRPFADQEVLAPDFMLQVNHLYRAARPWLDLMSEILTTDVNGTPLGDQ
ncbi:DUF2461 domain-containing protein [Robiginitalea sp. M366]|uniref:DUF2461 domain-containing protein n=1 Tax=Robiginitalea aestuariiviva TaxID=3036903 RepID=UPI00240E5F5C|nr:DUF2461 domain-containing protein [Robiginitalea aestuariiviva]MDG1572949.1 DUF2461 domain-containing protein [Robiginitalea aestuariiviva]